jgi:DNA-binding NtrC family response regulator
VAASNRDLLAEVGAGRFRSDLFYRISVTSVPIPPLRERPEDISALVERFGRDVAQRHGVPVRRFDADVLRAFEAYAWPGNVRELRNVVEGLALLTAGDVVRVADLPRNIASAVVGKWDSAASDGGLQDVERDAIAAAIRKHRGNLTRAATQLGISKSTLYLKMKKYTLESIVREVRPAAR